MDKITYLAELAEGLARWVPQRERQDILRYYAEYFEEAGSDREAEVIAELGDPWALSCRLAVEGGYVTHEKAASWKPKKTWRRVLIGTAVGLSIFVLVAGTGLLGLLGFNFIRTVSDPVRFIGEAEQVTVVDWGISPVWDGEFHVGYSYMESDPGVYFIDDESVASFSSIDADISLGNIEVVAGEDYTLSVRRGEALLGYEPVLEFGDGVLRLRDSDLSRQVQVDSWDDLKNLLGVGQGTVEITITVPYGAKLDRVSVKTGLGNVLLYGLSAESVTAETGLGNVECYEPQDAMRLELETGMGNVNLILKEAHNGLNIDLESGKGNVEASLCGCETDYSYALKSGWGYVAVNGVNRDSVARRWDSAPYRLNAESGWGNVNVYFTFS